MRSVGDLVPNELVPNGPALTEVGRSESLRLVAEQPSVRADEAIIEVSKPLEAMLPHGGLQRGATLHLNGPASYSLMLSLLAVPTRQGKWAVVVGDGDVGLSAAADLGVALERLVLVEQPPRSAFLTVLGACIGAFDLVVIDPGRLNEVGGGRRLRARARERGTVLVQLGGTKPVWGEGAEIELTATTQRWDGLGVGHGHLSARQVNVATQGRRNGARGWTTSLWMPDHDGELRSVTEDPNGAHAGADVDRLVECSTSINAMPIHEHVG
jgi:hypothetical protein